MKIGRTARLDRVGTLGFVLLAACASSKKHELADTEIAAETATTSARPRESSTSPAAPAASVAARPRRPGEYPWEGAEPCSTRGVGYLSSAKTSEAKLTLGIILRDAQAAFEREQFAPEPLPPGSAAASFSHALCKSANAIPSTVPAGTKTAPSKDWDSGDETTGWRCLRFSISDPIYFQYRYARGTGYLGPARGLPDPGPDGFEASAVGDLNGDGKTSLFTAVGVVDKKKGEVVVSPDIYCADPGE